MNLLKYVVIFAILVYGVYWVSAHGIYRWYDYQIEQAVEKYYKKKEFYPTGLQQLTGQKYKTDSGQKKYFMSELPQPRQGYKWSYSPDRKDKVKMVPKMDK